MLNKYLPTKLCKRPKVPRTLFPFQNTESLQISKQKKLPLSNLSSQNPFNGGFYCQEMVFYFYKRYGIANTWI
jgi:hypothetical protein